MGMDATASPRKRNLLLVASVMTFIYLLFILFADIAGQLSRSRPDEGLSLQVGTYMPYDGFFFLVLALIMGFCFLIRILTKKMGGNEETESDNGEESSSVLTLLLFGTTVINCTILCVFLLKGIGDCFDSVISPCAGPFNMKTFFDVTLQLGKTSIFSFLLIFPKFNKVIVLFLFFSMLTYVCLLYHSSRSAYSKSVSLLLLNLFLLLLITVVLVGTDFVITFPLIGPMVR
jgi:hypothetical protein